MKTSRTLGAAVLGLLFGLFVAIDLVMLGVIALNSLFVTLLPLLGLLGGGALAVLAGRRNRSTEA